MPGKAPSTMFVRTTVFGRNRGSSSPLGANTPARRLTAGLANTASVSVSVATRRNEERYFGKLLQIARFMPARITQNDPS